MNLNEEAKKLSPILKELCNGTYSNLENLYESDHADGDGFVDRASELLILLANRLTNTENAFDAAMRAIDKEQATNKTLLDALRVSERFIGDVYGYISRGILGSERLGALAVTKQAIADAEGVDDVRTVQG